MTANQIVDETSLRVWLESQTREVAIAIVHRAAMRVAPLFWSLTHPASPKSDSSILLASRVLLASGIAVVRPSAKVLAAVHSAADSDELHDPRFVTEDTSEGRSLFLDAANHAGSAVICVGSAAVYDHASVNAVAGAGTAAGAAAAFGAIKFVSSLTNVASMAAAKAAREAFWETIARDSIALGEQVTGSGLAVLPLWLSAENRFLKV